MYRNIHPFNHVAVGTDEIPGTETEITEVQDAINLWMYKVVLLQV
jgi:hypothetical protein